MTALITTNTAPDAVLDTALDFKPVCDDRRCERPAAWIAVTRDDVDPDVLLACETHFSRINQGRSFTVFGGQRVPTIELIASWRRL